MNPRVDLKSTKCILGAAAEVSTHIILYCWKWKEDRCPVRSGGTKCDYIANKKRKRGEDSIWEEVYHTGRVALVLVRDWERGALITAREQQIQSSRFGCLSVLRTEIPSVSQKRSMALLGGPVRTLNGWHLAANQVKDDELYSHL